MINKELVQFLQHQDKSLELNKELSTYQTNFPLMLVPDGFNMKNLESYMPNRSSYRFNFDTKSIDDFVAYAEEFDQEGAKCFVDPDDISAKIVFDIGTEEAPLHQEHTAMLKLKKTAAFVSLLRLNGLKLNQRDSIDFIEDFSDFISVVSNTGEAMTVGQAVNSISKITIESARSMTSEMGDFSESLSAMEKAEIKGANKFPHILKFTCAPYLGLEKREFEIKISYLTGGEKPALSFRVMQLEPHQEDIANEFKELLVSKLDGKQIKTLIGIGETKN